MMRWRFWLALVLLFGSVLSARPVDSAAAGEKVSFYPGASVRFEQITVVDGLSQNGVLALLQDRQGYLWIGTQDGLDRYDGYTFTYFKNDSLDTSTISFNSITALFKDRDGF